MTTGDHISAEASSSDAEQKQIHATAPCVGCGGVITDRTILHVAPNLFWHTRCLKCVQCSRSLGESHTCYIKDGKTLCRDDYNRLMGFCCHKCHGPIDRCEVVQRAGAKVFHMDCFRCSACLRSLTIGEEILLRDEGLLCKADFDLLCIERRGAVSTNLICTALSASLCNNGNSTAAELIENNNNNNNNTNHNNNNNNSNNINNNDLKIMDDTNCGFDSSVGSPIDDKASEFNESMDGSPRPSDICISDLSSNMTSCGALSKMSSKRVKDQKTTRVRTVLNEKQLHTLRTCYNANPRPDALMKEQLVEMTSLSPRVIRVWFQNKRCKDKKKQILMKQIEQQQQKNGNNLQRALSGVPLVAGSPVRHDAQLPSGGVHVDIQQFSSPWNTLTPCLAPTQDSVDGVPAPPAFQQLINAYHVMYPSDDEDDSCVSVDESLTFYQHHAR